MSLVAKAKNVKVKDEVLDLLCYEIKIGENNQQCDILILLSYFLFGYGVS